MGQGLLFVVLDRLFKEIFSLLVLVHPEISCPNVVVIDGVGRLFADCLFMLHDGCFVLLQLVESCP